MSKADAQRAMREAKYARLRASGPTRREEAAARGAVPDATPPETVPSGPAAPGRAARSTAATQPAEATGAATLCGHQSISGRTCTREAGHPQKSHRYG